MLPLQGLRVLDLSGGIGSYGTRLLASAGATVTKVEPPGGDPQRRRPPFRDGAAGPDRSLTFSYYNAGKNSVTVDVSDPASAETLDRLAQDTTRLGHGALPERLELLLAQAIQVLVLRHLLR